MISQSLSTTSGERAMRNGSSAPSMRTSSIPKNEQASRSSLLLGLRVRFRALVQHRPVSLLGGLHELAVQLLVVSVDAVSDGDDGDLVSARDVDAARRRGVREVMRMSGDREDSELLLTHG